MKGTAWPPSRLEEWRRQRGYSGRQLAAMVPCSANWLSLLENGHVHPSTHMRARLAEVLQVPEEALFP